jgi:hypothetical protein
MIKLLKIIGQKKKTKISNKCWKGCGGKEH